MVCGSLSHDCPAFPSWWKNSSKCPMTSIPEYDFNSFAHWEVWNPPRLVRQEKDYWLMTSKIHGFR